VLDERHVDACIALSEAWCTWRRCSEDLGLTSEWEAVGELLRHFHRLEVVGGVLLCNGRVEAYSVGELLNEDTAVVHIEKANPDIPGLYALINQQFCENSWHAVTYVNREQDLGEEGLRKAKLSYYPDHLVEKHRIRFA
jgi:hypothetical protein